MLNQYLLFTLCNEKYAIEVGNVQEVLAYADTEVSKIPCALPYVEGLINSRGRGIPVVSLRKKFRIPDAAVTKDTRIIVLELPQDGSEMIVLGAQTDSVQEVIGLEAESVENAPRFGCRIPSKFICGMVRYNDEFVTLLDTQLVFSKKETDSMREVDLLTPVEDEEEIEILS